MTIKRLKLRLAAATMFALLAAPFAVPASALAHEISCEQLSCGCCIIVCNCSNDEISNICSTAEETAEEEENSQTTEQEAAGSDDASDQTNEPSGNSNDLIRFNELLPNPVGTDTAGEFIELINLGSSDAELADWKIRTAAGKEYALPSGTLPADSQVMLPYSETKITLTNSGMTLQLVGPDGSVKDTVTYPDEAEEGSAYAKSVYGWFWTTTPTPGQNNVITVDTVTDGESGSIDEVTPAEEATQDTDNVSAVDESLPVAPQIRLSEIMPAPEGDDALEEWVELHNIGTAPAVLTGWLLDDAEGGSNAYAIPADTTVPTNGYLVLRRPETKLTLNNDTDAVRLFAPDGTIVDQVVYDGVNEGESLAFGAGSWSWTATATPGATNVLSSDEAQVEAEEADDVVVVDTDEDEAQVEVLTVEQAHNIPNETRITMVGVVTMPLGVIGATIFGVRDLDAEYGATVRIYASDRPDLEIGDIVQVDGTVRRKDSGELRLDTFGSEPIMIVGSTDSIEAPELRIEELDGACAGLAVTVSGTVTDIGSDWFIITDSAAEREIKVEMPTGSTIPFSSGDEVSVNGVVRVERSVVALAVLSDEDVMANETAVDSDESATADDASSVAVADEEQPNGMTLPFLVVGALGAGGVAYRGIKSRQDKRLVDIG
ncbi:MAG: lamin tail domain-containing protein [Patescibacteria group bacterium]